MLRKGGRFLYSFLLCPLANLGIEQQGRCVILQCKEHSYTYNTLNGATKGSKSETRLVQSLWDTEANINSKRPCCYFSQSLSAVPPIGGLTKYGIP